VVAATEGTTVVSHDMAASGRMQNDYKQTNVAATDKLISCILDVNQPDLESRTFE